MTLRTAAKAKDVYWNRWYINSRVARTYVSYAEAHGEKPMGKRLAAMRIDVENEFKICFEV